MVISNRYRAVLVAIILVASLAVSGCSKNKRADNLSAKSKQQNASDSRVSGKSAESSSLDTTATEGGERTDTIRNPNDIAGDASHVSEDHVSEDHVSEDHVPGDQREDENLASKNAADQLADELERVPAGTWTTRRLVVLAPGGPVLMDLSVSVGNESLESASEAALASVAAELMPDSDQPLTWNSLLEQRAVQSGWLGNLVADDEQREQLIAMYDLSQDGNVEVEELPAFLSRGLSRNAALQLVDAGNASDMDINASPWGKADRDVDFSLDTEELAGMEGIIRGMDLNGDSTVTLQELAESQGMQMQTDGVSGRSMLETSSVIFAEVPSDLDSDESVVEASERVVDLPPIFCGTTHFSSPFRDQWQSWSDELWSRVDGDQNQQIDVYEVDQLFTVGPQFQLFVGLPAAVAPDGSSLYRAICGQGAQAAWNAHASGGHLMTSNCSTVVEVEDAFSETGRQLMRNRLESAIGNAQLRAFFTNQLQLSENAFEIIDSDGDKQLNDDEFEQVWRWLSVRQGSRLLARWEISSTPWFQLADENGDSKLAELELNRLADKLSKLDRNEDGSLTPNELPMVARLKLERADSRLAAAPFDIPSQDGVEVDLDWFSAMDTNRDGVLNRSEFLGTRAEFTESDKNKDGFVSREEVVKAP